MSKPLKYFGGKTNMVSKLLTLLPEIVHFRSVFVGSGSLEFQVSPNNKSEIWNDIDGEITNFYEVLRNEATFLQFRKLCELTPFSQELFEQVKVTNNLPFEYFGNSVHRAWAFFIKNRFSRGGDGKNFANSTSRLRRQMNENISAWLTSVEGLIDFHNRLKYVEIRKMDFRYFIEKYDRKDCIFYCDPPYILKSRVAGGYKYEMSDEDHIDLLNILQDIEGKFLLHGYPNEIYSEYIIRNNWNVKEFEVSKSSSSSKIKPKAVELVITNYLL